jgi:heptosyltransferase III
VTIRHNVLIYRLGSLGDTVVALPCFHLVARAFADKVRILLTNAPVHSKAAAATSVLGESGLINVYISYPVGTRNIIGLAKLFWRIRRLKVATLVYLTAPRGEFAAKRDEMFFRLCGVKEIIGLPSGPLAIHCHRSVGDRYEAEATRLARCLAKIGDARPNDPASWDLRLNDTEQARATNALQPLDGAMFLTVGIASKKQVTDWGVENWRALMPHLRKRFPKHALVFVGAREDRSNADDVAQRWAGRSLNLSGDLSPRESAAVIQRAHLFLGVDSGPMHLAASVGTPSVLIFAAHKLPGIWFPMGDSHEVIYHQTECCGCNLETCIVEKKKCISSISVDEVMAAVIRLEERNRAVASAGRADMRSWSNKAEPTSIGASVNTAAAQGVNAEEISR